MLLCSLFLNQLGRDVSFVEFQTKNRNKTKHLIAYVSASGLLSREGWGMDKETGSQKLADT